MNMYEAIFVKKPVKKFVMEEIDEKIIGKIAKFAEDLPLIFEDTKIEFHIIYDVAETKVSAKHPFPKAPYYLVVACEREKKQMLNAGFFMEQMGLYIASIGLATGNLNHMKLKMNLEEEFEHEPILMLPFGKTNEICFRDGRKIKRLPENEIVLYKTNVNADVKHMVKAARLTPSFMNTQPWRLVVYENRIHVFCKKNIFHQFETSERKLLDIGAMAANMLLVAEEMWIDVQVEEVENISNKYFKNNDYMFSILVK